jgi:hypothetical protein
MDKLSRKYNSGFRKNIKQKISNLVDKNDYISIYKIINSEYESKISINRNGIYFNLNLLSDDCIEKLNEFFNDRITTSSSENKPSKIKYEPYVTSESEIPTGHKLSNQEKTLIKKFHT